jgi:hypothetical protein
MSYSSNLRGNRRAICSVIACSWALTVVRVVDAQQQVPPPTQLQSYHPPVLALVQPANGAGIPLDRAVVVFRFASGDSTDPVDALSLVVTVDGKDRSALFQSARDMAWGPLAPAEELSSLSIGSHNVIARVCSIRGICGDASVPVIVTASPVVAETPAKNRKRTLMEMLIAAVKKLLEP